MRPEQRLAQAREHRQSLMNAAGDGELAVSLRQHEGFALFEALVQEYRARRYLEWLRSEIDSEEYRAECRVFDWLFEGLDALAEQGDKAGAELLSRGWTG